MEERFLCEARTRSSAVDDAMKLCACIFVLYLIAQVGAFVAPFEAHDENVHQTQAKNPLLLDSGDDRNTTARTKEVQELHLNTAKIKTEFLEQRLDEERDRIYNLTEENAILRISNTRYERVMARVRARDAIEYTEKKYRKGAIPQQDIEAAREIENNWRKLNPEDAKILSLERFFGTARQRREKRAIKRKRTAEWYKFLLNPDRLAFFSYLVEDVTNGTGDKETLKQFAYCIAQAHADLCEYIRHYVWYDRANAYGKLTFLKSSSQALTPLLRRYGMDHLAESSALKEERDAYSR
nr:PREDICTED: uncharacterized protein LOC109037933 isoform X3 [Bemisia tabaci]